MQPENPLRLTGLPLHFTDDNTNDEVFMVKLIKADFNGQQIQFNDSGWFNATKIAEQHGKRLDHFLSSKETKDYIDVLNTRNLGSLIQAKKGRNGGTWLHPKLAVMFARYVSAEFAVWCDEQIEKIIHGEADSIDWKAMRHAAKSSNKVQNQVLQLIRQDAGKDTSHFHYANEAKLVNFALKGEYKSIERESLSGSELDLLAKMESRNAVLLARGVDRDTRREVLCSMNEHLGLQG